MCRRTTEDPLVRSFLDTYGLNLLARPREDVAIGDVYMYGDGRVSIAGSVTHLLEPKPEMPRRNLNEQMADIRGKASDAVSFHAGIGLLESFLTALGPSQVISKVRAGYETANTHALRFRFAAATRDSVDPSELGGSLRGSKLIEDHPLYHEDHSYYLVTGIARTPSLSVVAEDKSGDSVDLAVGLMHVADASTGVSAEATGKGEVTYKGDKQLAFGVELYELYCDNKRGRLRMRAPRNAFRVLADEPDSDEPLIEPAFVGGPEGDILIDLS